MSSLPDLEHELAQTRERMSAELDALARKLDVPTRAKEKLGGAKAGAKARLRTATPSSGDVQRTAESNPLGMVVGGLAAGLIAGLLLPQTEMEDEKVGPMADRLRDEAAAVGREAVGRGRKVAEQALTAAKETAQDAGREQGERLQDTAKKRLAAVKD